MFNEALTEQLDCIDGHAIGLGYLAIEPAFVGVEQSESPFSLLRRVLPFIEYVLQERNFCVSQGDDVNLPHGNPPA